MLLFLFLCLFATFCNTIILKFCLMLFDCVCMTTMERNAIQSCFNKSRDLTDQWAAWSWSGGRLDLLPESFEDPLCPSLFVLCLFWHINFVGWKELVQIVR